jgi:aromatic-amino-acid transaminase
MTASALSSVQMAPRDPILGLNELYNADPNPKKVNLGVGVYTDDGGKVPLLECVRRAEQQLVEQASPRGYLPIDGLPVYDKAVQALLLGKDHAAIRDGRVVTAQSLGGTGGLKVGADFLRRLLPEAQVWISDPSWENHRALFENAGFTVNTYPYYDAAAHGLDFAGMLRALEAMPAGAVVVLHACCHNPTGLDLDAGQWQEVAAVVTRRQLVPFMDIAYQGFGEGIDADAGALRMFAGLGIPVFVSSSFSKSFSLYGERAGALTIVTDDRDEAAPVLSQVKRLIRTNYSNPPTHGGKIVETVLGSPDLRGLWEMELAQMRERIHGMRSQLVDKIHAQVPGADFSFVKAQRGMFSYSGLSKPQVLRLREEFAIYALDTGRICVAALNSRNIDYVANAVATVIR